MLVVHSVCPCFTKRCLYSVGSIFLHPVPVSEQMPLVARVVAEVFNAAFTVDDGRLGIVSKLEVDAVFLVAAAVCPANRIDAKVVVSLADLVQVVGVLGDRLLQSRPGPQKGGVQGHLETHK